MPVCTDVKWVADVYHKEARIRVDGPIWARRHRTMCSQTTDCFPGWSYSSLYSSFGLMNTPVWRPVTRPGVADLGPRSAAMTEWTMESREDASGSSPFEVFPGELAIAVLGESISLPRRGILSCASPRTI